MPVMDNSYFGGFGFASQNSKFRSGCVANLFLLDVGYMENVCVGRPPETGTLEVCLMRNSIQVGSSNNSVMGAGQIRYRLLVVGFVTSHVVDMFCVCGKYGRINNY